MAGTTQWIRDSLREQARRAFLAEPKQDVTTDLDLDEMEAQIEYLEANGDHDWSLNAAGARALIARIRELEAR